MTNETPYTYDEEQFPDVIKSKLIRTDTFTFRGEQYPFGVVGRDAAPFPYFVGMNGGNNLFASEDVVDAEGEHLQQVSLGHEILCNRTHKEYGGEIRCPMSEEEMLSGLPPEVREDILQKRYEMFNGIVEAYKIDASNPESEFQSQLLATRAFIKKELQRLSI